MLRPEYTLSILGEEVKRPTDTDESLNAELRACCPQGIAVRLAGTPNQRSESWAGGCGCMKLFPVSDVKYFRYPAQFVNYARLHYIFR